tara:strand:+ start:1855 stop:2931 length:1077 start_codon:yes stop_codon:yes gene_type:complete
MKKGAKKLALFFFIIFVTMINEVRNAVLAFLNKNNYGYITPQDFNLYAKQAQLDLFEDLFFQYNYQVNKENARQSGTGYADIKKGIEEDIDIFSQDVILLNTPTNLYGTTNSSNLFALPDDYYFINKVYYRPTSSIMTNAVGTVYNFVGTPLGYGLTNTDANAPDFLTSVRQGDLVINTTTRESAFVTRIVNSTVLGLSRDIFPVAGPAVVAYMIISNSYITEIERMSQKKINSLLSSTLTAPSKDFPVYSVSGNNITIYPVNINSFNEFGVGVNNFLYMWAQYIRYPRDPNWTFVNITGGDPVFDQTQLDYQNFELPEDMYTDLVLKILQYAGVSIRELDVVNYASTQETLNNQTEA